MNRDIFIRTGSLCLRSACATLLLGAATGAQADDASDLAKALADTRPLVDIRLRYEEVDQTGITESANAPTLRARLGGETGAFLDTKLLVEGEGMFRLDRDYRPDNAVPTYTQYPVVADPENYVLNRLQLQNTALPGTTVTLGRQVILLDDQRFVGNTGWRQNEVTFDAVRVVNTSVSGLVVDATMLDKVHRIYGVDSPQGTYTGDSYLVNVSYELSFGKLTGFSYLLDFDPINGLTGALDPRRGSTSTTGGRFAGAWPLDAVKLGYSVSYATQKPRGDNPLSFRNDYFAAELKAGYRGLTAAVGDENMHGNGTAGFATPLATTHLFDGWADKFLVTPANGLDNRYGSLTWAAGRVLGLDALSTSLIYRAFAAERIDASYGHEYDVSMTGKWHHYTGLVAYADYVSAPSTPTAIARDTTKFWAQMEYQW
jgi:hypothetical protein